MTKPRFSIVIPTRDRASSLRLCLTALLAQMDPELDDVLVVDDGSTDETDLVRQDFPSVRWLSSGGRGTCAARNVGVAESRGDVVLFVDDDIVIAEGLLDRHRAFHESHLSQEDALVGLVTWDRSQPITKHMLWLEDGGPLFSFNTINDHDDVDPSHFCTANVSVKRSLLSTVDGPFDERIKRFTDVELGHRLAKTGMRLHYDPEAIAWHLRSDTPATTDRRMFVVGEASVLLDQIHPGVAPPAAPRTFARRMKVLLAKLMTPLTPMLPEGLASKIWASRAAWAYSSGRASKELDA